MPVFPVYALMFADAGLSLGQISMLFGLWSVVGIVLEVPSGAWADTVSRRALLAAASVTYAAAFATWVVLPTFPGFALGFVLWGVSSSLASGTFEALAYDELAALGAGERYAQVIGRGHALAIAAMGVTTLAAAPLLALGGYALVGWASVGVCLVQLLVVLSLPSAAPAVVHEHSAGAWQEWREALRTGLVEATTSRLVRGAVLAGAAVVSLQVLDEYFGLLLRDQGAALVLVPVLLGLVNAGEAVGALLAPRAAGWAPARVGAMLACAGVLVGLAAVVHDPLVAAVALVVGYGLVQVCVVVSEVRLQDTIEHGARATVLSVANVLAELIALAAFAWFALAPGRGVALPMLGVAAVAVLLGPLVSRWLPTPATPDLPRPGDG